MPLSESQLAAVAGPVRGLAANMCVNSVFGFDYFTKIRGDYYLDGFKFWNFSKLKHNLNLHDLQLKGQIAFHSSAPLNSPQSYQTTHKFEPSDLKNF